MACLPPACLNASLAAPLFLKCALAQIHPPQSVTPSFPLLTDKTLFPKPIICAQATFLYFAQWVLDSELGEKLSSFLRILFHYTNPMCGAMPPQCQMDSGGGGRGRGRIRIWRLFVVSGKQLIWWIGRGLGGCQGVAWQRRTLITPAKDLCVSPEQYSNKSWIMHAWCM